MIQGFLLEATKQQLIELNSQISDRLIKINSEKGDKLIRKRKGPQMMLQIKFNKEKKICNICNEEFKQDAGLKQHITKKHSLPQLFQQAQQQFEKQNQFQQLVSKSPPKQEPLNDLVTHSLGDNIINRYHNTTRLDQFSITQWTVCSLKPTTLQMAKQNIPHIICLQELTGKTIENSPGYNYAIKLGQSTHQGGVAIGIHSSINFTNVTEKINPPNFHKYDFIAVHCKSEAIDLLLCNFYINSKTIYNQEKNTIQMWSQDLMFQLKQSQKIIRCGDFNTPNLDITFYQYVIPSEISTFYRKQVKRTLISRTDHCLMRNFTDPIINSAFNDLSDHCPINMNSSFENIHHRVHRVVINKKEAYKLNIEANKFTDFTCQYNDVRINFRKKKIIAKQRITLQNYKAFNVTLKQKLEQDTQAYSNSDSKEAFKSIRCLAILNPNKRDGGIFRCYKDQNGELKCGNICVTNCLRHLGIQSQSSPFTPLQQPSLPPLTEIEIQELQSMMCKDKAITKDGISDTFIKQTKNYRLLQDLWKNSTLETNIYLGEARLIPLNKCFPDIPTYNQFRDLSYQ